MNPLFSQLSSFVNALHPDAAQLDKDGALLKEWYAVFCGEHLHELGGVRSPLSGREFAEVLATLSEVSGTFAFVVLQQIVANMSLNVSEKDVWPVVGVAFGHLRTLECPAPLWDGKTVTDFVPWLTGANIFPEVILGVRTIDGEEVFARVNANDRPEFCHTEPMRLVACTGTNTVAVHLRDMPLPKSHVLRIQPRGTMATGDAQGVLYQTPLMLGCARACLSLIAKSPRVGATEKQRCREIVERQIQTVLDAFSGVDALRGRQLRAQLGDMTVRLARLTVMACGGNGLQTGHTAERLYREALLYSLMAQTPEIVQDAFAEVFP